MRTHNEVEVPKLGGDEGRRKVYKPRHINNIEDVSDNQLLA